ncbi:MAG: DNA-binding protein [Candidatus Aenigmatarchaeota archaeon]
MRVVLDASAIIYLNDFSKFDEIYTVPEVIDEVKDRTSRLKIATINLQVKEPNFNSIMDVTQMAKETGDLEKLSSTDIKILALAKTTGSTIISDDYSLQNVAEKMRIPYLSLFNKKIQQLIIWKKICKSCGRKYYKGKVCKVCGGKLYRIPREIKKIKK